MHQQAVKQRIGQRLLGRTVAYWRGLVARWHQPTPYPVDSYEEWKYLRREAEIAELQAAFRAAGLRVYKGGWAVANRNVSRPRSRNNA